MDFFDALVRYETDLWNHLDRRLADAGATSLAVLEALRVVGRHAGRARVAELQDELRITVGAASKLVDRLERDGLAVRAPNPEDRRSSVLSLTAAGVHQHDTGLAIVNAALAEHTEGFGSDLELSTRIFVSLTDRLTAEKIR